MSDLVSEHYAKLASLTKLTVQRWQDILSLPAKPQADVLRGYADCDWVRQKDVLAAVIAVLGVIGSLAGVVSGVAGAAGAVAALRAL